MSVITKLFASGIADTGSMHSKRMGPSTWVSIQRTGISAATMPGSGGPIRFVRESEFVMISIVADPHVAMRIADKKPYKKLK